MKLTTTGKKEIVEVPWGVYLWQMPDGSFVADDDGHFLMVASTLGNEQRKEAMRNAVRDFGINEGKPYFMAGHRPVTDEEYEEQRQRMLFGLTPDPLDVASIVEDRKNVKRYRS